MISGRIRYALLLLALGLCWPGSEGLASTPAGEPKRVLLLHSFGHDFAPFSMFTGHFRAELGRAWPGRMDFYDVSLLAARHDGPPDEAPFIGYLAAQFSGHAPDLVVPIGGPAARFAQRNRQRLFPDVPMLFAAVDQRIAADLTLGAGETVVAVRNDFAAAVAAILELVPRATRIAVVIGDSPIERFWAAEIRRELQPLAGRVELLWFDGLSFDEIKARAAALAPGSAILYTLLAMDGAGVSNPSDLMLTELSRVAAAPVFGIFESQLGMGIVGGRLISANELAARTARAAVRILRGEVPGSIAIPALDPGTPAYDWRELRRWDIDERRLPQGSALRFRERSVWEQYRLHIAAVATLVALQAALIAGLLVQRARRRRAEREALALSGRLITAHEDERRRIGRELHDDLTQRLALLAFDAARLQSGEDTAGGDGSTRSMHEALVRLSEDVHGLSYRLHPSVIEDLGLVEAIRAECDVVARREPLSVAVDAGEIPRALPSEVGLCLFRVTQEALRNVVRHARAGAVHVSIEPREAGVWLRVSDDGAGFEPKPPGGRPNLGIAGMRERVRLLGGRLQVESAPGAGTTVVAWVPVAGEAS